MKNLLLILFGCFAFGQNFDSQSFNSQFNTNLDVLQREVARQYTPKDVAYYGNKYYYEEPQPAFLELFEAEKPLKVLTNYNLIDETFELQTDWKPLSISTDKVSRVRFKDDTFIYPANQSKNYTNAELQLYKGSFFISINKPNGYEPIAKIGFNYLIN